MWLKLLKVKEKVRDSDPHLYQTKPSTFENPALYDTDARLLLMAAIIMLIKSG